MGKNWFFVLYGNLAIAVFARIIPPHTGAVAIFLDVLLDMEIGAILLLLHQEGWWPRP